MKLIDEWRSAHRLLSIRLSALYALALGCWSTLDKDVQLTIVGYLGIKGTTAVAFVAVLGFVVARLVKQAPPAPKE